jgi:hypothetical protein
MSGYCGYSMSNNAVAAYEGGKMPASKLAKALKVSTTAVRAILSPSEWHHTSSKFNETDFYDGRLLISLARNCMPDFYDYDDDEDLFDAAESFIALKEFFAKEKLEAKEQKLYGRIEWLEWSGSWKHPKADEYEFTGEVTLRGQFYYFTVPSGRQVKKKIGSNGTHFYKKEKPDGQI